MSEVKKALDAAVVDVTTNALAGKKWYLSKTFWVNVVAAGGLILQVNTGFIVGPEYQALALTLINLGLRKVTRDPVIW